MTSFQNVSSAVWIWACALVSLILSRERLGFPLLLSQGDKQDSLSEAIYEEKNFFLQPHLWHMEVPRLGVELELQLLQGHTNARSEPHLRPMPQLVAMPDPQPTERSQGSNLHPHGYYVGFLAHWTTRGTPQRKSPSMSYCRRTMAVFLSQYHIC